MTPAALQHLLITHAPDVPGITAAAPRDDDNPYGLTVTLTSGGRVWWTITGTSPAPAGPPVHPARTEPAPGPVPDLTGQPVPVAHVEQAMIATAVTQAPGQICHIDRYSTRPDPPAVRYGATIGCRDGWKLFLSCYGTTRPGQARPEQPYHSHSHI
jgi:hypothetical protein